MSAPAGPVRSIGSLVLAFALCFSAARLGSIATTPNLGWYATLAKPFFTPPNWAFPVAWTTLFILMAIALWRVATRAAEPRQRQLALGAFMVQLLLNIGWSFAFFGQQNPALGLAVIAALIIAIAATMALFRPIDRIASLLLLPYILWVCYAGLLNATIWWMNA
ncbi:TspO/MBR family protein [Agaricicola taiwanensis]|nr:TspO/MBR family protein [Agaricicola taiwanensis]